MATINIAPGRSRNIAIVVILIMTVVLGIISILIGIQLQRNQAPDDAAADACPVGTTNIGNDNIPICECPNGKQIPKTGTADDCIEIRQPNQQCEANENPEKDRCTTNFCCTCGGSTGNACLDTGIAQNCTDYCNIKNGTTPPPVTPPSTSPIGICPNTNQQADWCAVFNCPNGDTNGDGECKAGDTGVTQQVYTSNCPTRPTTNCGQVDYYDGGTAGVDWTNYCGHTFINLSNCTGTSTPPPPPSSVACVSLEFIQPASVSTVTQGETVRVDATFQCGTSGYNDAVRLRVINSTSGAIIIDTLEATTRFDTVANGTCTYVFQFSTQTLTNGSYDLRILTDFNSAASVVTTPAACQKTLTIQQSSSSTSSTTTSSSSSSSSSSTLPATGLFDEDGRPLLLGLILIIFGVFINRIYGAFQLIQLNQATQSDTSYGKPTYRRKDTSEFERKIIKD